MQWLKGDNNTKFFYKMTNVRKYFNDIHSLMIGDSRVDNEEELNYHVEDYFKHLYSEDRPVRPKLEDFLFP